MLHILWEYRVPAGKRADFERCYNSRGTWAELFQRSSAYRGTTLLRDPGDPARYLTLDVWDDDASFHRFRQEFAAEYAAIDRQMGAFTEFERHIGNFEPL